MWDSSRRGRPNIFPPGEKQIYVSSQYVSQTLSSSSSIIFLLFFVRHKRDILPFHLILDSDSPSLILILQEFRSRDPHNGNKIGSGAKLSPNREKVASGNSLKVMIHY